MDHGTPVKVTFLGDVGCGKSSIIARFISNTFELSNATTVGACSYNKSLNISGKNINFYLWDTAGQEKYRSISKMLYRDARAVVLVYDCCSRGSFQSLESWHNSVMETAPSNIIIIIVGNKKDFENEYIQVSEEEAEEYAKKIGASIYQVSAKTGENIDMIFYEIAMKLNLKVTNSVAKTEDYDPNQSFQLSNTNPKKKKKNCC
ncbi:hypothetical protein SteCoe_9562 [Stentor coeruleus]|uniref:Uncharacterized protein n=1 Tax=Stentor coeruleus TaxID=5963 RepID=A0A1R2CHP7_9CILI|nr:hypothetical protein SteCoe_9562 [Stentor coeruleus]